VPRDFADLIVEIGHGETHQRLTEDLAKIVQAVEETGLPGKMTITIKVKRSGERTAMVDTQWKTDLPRHPAPASAYFFEAGGGLAKSDPRQTKLPLRDIDRPADRPLRATVTVIPGRKDDGNDEK
jgi:hypothetical protein